MVSKLKTMGGVVVVLALAGGWLATRKHVDAFNEYIVPLRPALAQQDALFAKASKANEADLKKSIAGWVTEAKALQAKIDAAAPEDPEVAAIHVHMKAQAKAYAEFFVAVQAVAGGDASAAATRDAKGGERKAALAAFVKARDKHFKKHNIKLDKAPGS